MPDSSSVAADVSLVVNTLEHLLLDQSCSGCGDKAMALVYASVMFRSDLVDLALEAASRFACKVLVDRGLATEGGVVVTDRVSYRLRLTYVSEAGCWTYETAQGDRYWELPLRVLCCWLTAATEVWLGSSAASAGRNVTGGVRALLEAVESPDAMEAVLRIIRIEMGARGLDSV